MTNDLFNVVVIGAGAAGLLAADRAAQRGRSVLLLEKNRKPGVKILMSGGTRCNLTHACQGSHIVEAFGPSGRFLYSALAALGPQDLVDLIEAEGVPTKVEATGKIFPQSDRAADVLGALLARLRRSGAQLATGEAVLDIAANSPGFTVVTSGRTLRAETVIVTTGGKSYPGCGTTGDGYAWARRLGHEIVAPRPALVPVTTRDPWIAELKGITLADVCVRLLDPTHSSSKALSERRGSFLLTHFGLSGPAVLDISRDITSHEAPQTLQFACDLLPDLSENTKDSWLQQRFAADGKKELANLFIDQIPGRLWQSVLRLAGLAGTTRVSEVSRTERHRLAQTLHRLPIRIAGTRGFKKAEVTAGGVALSEVDSRTLQSKHVPGLYFAGEILDLDGPIGGYNFQAAFSTGYLAGENA